MTIIKNKGKSNNYVYDIHLDGTLVNALGLNILSNTDGFNFKLPDESKYRYTKEHPYISKGLSRETKEGKEYIGFEADVAEFNDEYMCDKHYNPLGINKMGLGIDEVLNFSLNISRKNYCDYFPEKPYPKDVKFVGNTVKSKKLAVYIENFLDKGVRLLLQNKGSEFVDLYNSYIDKIYNYRIPLKEIASKGKVKKTIPEYIKDCETITKAGNKKSRQAWMELVIKNNMKVDLGETVYFINTGNKKSHSDVKRVTHYYVITENGEKKDIKSSLDREWKADVEEGKNGTKNKTVFNEWVPIHHPEVFLEDEIVLYSELLPREIIESDKEYFCEEGKEYNVDKYIDQFNKRVSPLLVCFKKDIRSKILITNPNQKQYFTEEELELCSGEPNKEGDQDTYEQLMTMEDKEIKFWMSHPEWDIPFIKECDMDWDVIKNDYTIRMENEKKKGVDKIREQFDKIIDNLTNEDVENIEDGKIPASIAKISDYDQASGNFVSKIDNTIVLGTIYDIIDAQNFQKENKNNNIEMLIESETDQ